MRRRARVQIARFLSLSFSFPLTTKQTNEQCNCEIGVCISFQTINSYIRALYLSLSFFYSCYSLSINHISWNESSSACAYVYNKLRLLQACTLRLTPNFYALVYFTTYFTKCLFMSECAQWIFTRECINAICWVCVWAADCSMLKLPWNSNTTSTNCILRKKNITIHIVYVFCCCCKSLVVSSSLVRSFILSLAFVFFICLSVSFAREHKICRVLLCVFVWFSYATFFSSSCCCCWLHAYTFVCVCVRCVVWVCVFIFVTLLDFLARRRRKVATTTTTASINIVPNVKWDLVLDLPPIHLSPSPSPSLSCSALVLILVVKLWGEHRRRASGKGRRSETMKI